MTILPQAVLPVLRTLDFPSHILSTSHSVAFPGEFLTLLAGQAIHIASFL